MEMSDQFHRHEITNVYFFGSPEDGFKVYPRTDLAYNKFSVYYSNAVKEDWHLTVERTGTDTFQYTYALYRQDGKGVLTKSPGGRSGSLFGLSFTVKGGFFPDLKELRTACFERITELMLENPKLIGRNANGNIAFSAYRFTDVSDYLDRWSANIKKTLAEWKAYPASDIRPGKAGKTLYALHINSDAPMIDKYFWDSWNIRVSDHTSYPVVRMPAPPAPAPPSHD